MARRENLFGLTCEQAVSRMVELGLPGYRGRQIFRWMYARAVGEFDGMTDLPQSLRRELARRFVIRHPAAAARIRSRDGTMKHLFSLEDGSNVETVYIPDPPARPDREARHTVCLSTQVGCPLRCSFCFSGTVAFARNLTVGEVLGQFLLVKQSLPRSPRRMNVVFMGMGEPLLNATAVLDALRVLTDPRGFGVSPRRITVSTAGLAEELERFARQAPPVGLAVSLHAPTSPARDRLIPINRRYPREELIETTRRLTLPKRRRITFEYVLLGGENDSEEDARRLARLLRGLKVKVNLIAYNPWPGSPYRAASPEATARFAEVLASQGYTANLRRSRGDDVLAACGQLGPRPLAPAHGRYD